MAIASAACTPIIPKMSRNAVCLTVAFATIPDSFDSVSSKRVADNMLEELQADTDKVVLVPLDNPGLKIVNDTPCILTHNDKNYLSIGMQTLVNLFEGSHTLVALSFADIKVIITLSGNTYLGA